MSVTFVPCKLCPTQCEPVFDRVVVSYLIRGGTKVMWDLLPTFTDQSPLVFQLQAGRTANQNADDWEDVGGPVEDVFYAHDPEQRVWGKTNWAYYRVTVTSANGTYVSMPVASAGTLGKKDWLKARNLIRRRKTQFRLGEGQDGYLLKRRVAGQPCRRCLDTITLEVRDPGCASCYGTGFECGYFFPMACVWADVSPKSRRIQLDGGESRATVNDIVVQAEMVLEELMVEDDVWVNKLTDDRYYIHKIEHTAEVRGVPVLGNVEMRPIPFSSIIYENAIPDQLAALGLSEV